MTILLDVQIESQPYSENIIYVNSHIISQLNLPMNRVIPIVFGNRRVEATVALASSKSNLLILPSKTASQLLLPNGVQIHGKYDRENGLILGPTLGILVQSIDKKQPQEPFGPLTPFLAEVAFASKSKGTLSYVFTLDDIDLNNNLVKGWVLKGNHFEQRLLPIPKVIYNRISSRKFEKKQLEKILAIQNKANFYFFNDHFLNKWQVYELLYHTSVSNLLPTTKFYKNYSSIKDMLNSYPTTYLKPANGALGRGIIKIQKRANQYDVKYSRINGPTNLKYKSFGQMFKQLEPRLKSEPYIVQAGIPLIQMKNRPIDFRILVQKNSKGAWAVTSMVARIADEQNFVSNLARGGTQSKVFEAIKLSNLNPNIKLSRNHFINNSLAIAKLIESTTKGHFAELGIDLGVDIHGRIWLLEVNSKPSKNNDPGLNGPRPSVQRLIDYTRYLTGLQNERKTKKRKRKNKPRT